MKTVHVRRKGSELALSCFLMSYMKTYFGICRKHLAERNCPGIVLSCQLSEAKQGEYSDGRPPRKAPLRKVMGNYIES